jgi:hypothetical protein
MPIFASYEGIVKCPLLPGVPRCLPMAWYIVGTSPRCRTDSPTGHADAASGRATRGVTEQRQDRHVRFTMHTYLHLLPGMSAAAAEQFASLVAAASR